jgi:hypothetical protein
MICSDGTTSRLRVRRWRPRHAGSRRPPRDHQPSTCGRLR